MRRGPRAGSKAAPGALRSEAPGALQAGPRPRSVRAPLDRRSRADGADAEQNQQPERRTGGGHLAARSRGRARSRRGRLLLLRAGLRRLLALLAGRRLLLLLRRLRLL